MRRMMVAGIGLVLLTGCGGGADTATPAGTATSEIQVPSASPTPSPRMTTNGTLDPSSPASDAVSTDPLYQEAVQVYTAYFAELNKFEKAGRPGGKLPASMDRYITGDMKKVVQMTSDASNKAGLVMNPEGPDAQLTIDPKPRPGRGGSIVAIRVCVDSRQNTVLDRKTKKSVGKGILALKEVYFKRFDGQLKGFDTEAQKVSKCPF